MLNTVSGLSVGFLIFIVAVVFETRICVDSLRTRFQFTVLNLFDLEWKNECLR